MLMVIKRRPRVKITLTLPADLAEWIDAKVRDREYATRSHALEVAILELKKNKHFIKKCSGTNGGK
jgi:Arc/MetJ-type ribon-helix-helix transcriptional regulator